MRAALRFEVAQQAVERFLVGVVVFPGAEVADVARAAEAGGPGLIGFHHGVIQADGEGLLVAAGPGFEKPIQLAFHQLERLFAAQHQSFHSVPTQVEVVGVAEYVAKFHVFL